MNPPRPAPDGKNTPRHGAPAPGMSQNGRVYPVTLKAETGNEAESGWLADSRSFWIMTFPCFFPGVLFLPHAGLPVWNET
jgi:hypothetical protein